MNKYIFITLMILSGCANPNTSDTQCYQQTERGYCSPHYKIVGYGAPSNSNYRFEICCKGSENNRTLFFD